MAWIAAYQQLKDHRKLRDFARMLDTSRQEAAGILLFLWWWGLDNADKSGKLISATEDDIIDALSLPRKFHGNSTVVFTALCKSGWIEIKKDGIYIHDWSDYTKPWYQYKARVEKDRVRKGCGKKANLAGSEFHGISTEIPAEIPDGFHDSHTHTPIYDIDNDTNNKLTFSGNVFLTPEQHKTICQKFGNKGSDYSALKANHFITVLSSMKSQGYQSDNDLAEILKLIDVENGQQHAEGSMS